MIFKPMNKMTAREVDATLRRIAAERLAHARAALPVIERVLRAAPVRWIDDPTGETPSKVELELKPETSEALLNLCEAVVGIDGLDLEDDRMIGLLALAVLRGQPLWYRAPRAPREDS